MTFDIEKYLKTTEKELVNCCDKYFYSDSKVDKAVRYSLLNSGKRVRAMLVYLVAQMCKQEWENYTQLACAIEMVHCYSLIHDDLPCMDNDDLRRGKPSCHKAFDENIALLAGDALIGCSIEAIANNEFFAEKDKLFAIKSFCEAIGPKGMIYGQELDLKFENVLATKQELNLIHQNKTGQLISLCGKLGRLGASLTKEQKDAIDLFLANTGIVFQIVDDILDVEGSVAQLGKPIGSDGQNNKSTFISLYGMENSKKQVENLTVQATNALKTKFGEDADYIIEYTNYLSKRNK